MCCQIPASVGSSCNAAQECIRHAFLKIPQSIIALDNCVGKGMGIIAYLGDQIFSPIKNTLVSAAEKIINFVKNNWQPLVAYLFAWGVIITCTGLMYGFEGVALPLTIGLGCGLLFGIITGILTVKVPFDETGQTTLWNLLNEGIERLDANATRPIVLAVAVTVALAAAVAFPYVMGAVFGIFIGNQLATKAGAGRDLGRNPESVKNERDSLKQKLETALEKVETMKNRMRRLEESDEKKQLMS
ncbi:MAG TPA: hypothetical protein VIH61_06115, partial [Waddliaceae bacterium]